MKKNRRIHSKLNIICFILIAVLTVGLLTACSSDKNSSAGFKARSDTDNDTVYIYGINQTITSLVRYTYKPEEKTSTIREAQELMKVLSEAPENPDYISAVPDDLEVRNIAFRNNNLTISFSREYENLDSPREALLRAAVVKTLVQIDGVDTVTFKIVDDMLTDAQGNAVGAMTADSFIVNFLSEQDSTIEKTLTLYYITSDGTALVSEERNVHYNVNVALEQVILNNLAKEPDTEGAIRPIAPDVDVLSVSVQDGICYVDLSSNLFDEASNADRNAVIYSIVDSLCELDNINSVQLIVGAGDDAEIITSDTEDNLFKPDMTYLRNAKNEASEEEQ